MMTVVKIDLYTKSMLTVIAGCLLALCLKETPIVPTATASENADVMEVRLVGISKDIQMIPVEIQNTDLSVAINNTPLDVIINDPMLFGKKDR